MKRMISLIVVLVVLLGVSPSVAHAEILAMVNYESKPEQSIRKEGIAIIDVDPNSPTFGKILVDIPLPHNLVAHHIFYNKDRSKAYITALGKSVLHVMDMTRFPYRMKAVDIPQCKVLEDMTFSQDNKTWYLTCMGSQNVIVGDVKTGTPTKAISLPKPYPHGIALHDGIDRLLVTSTVRDTDFKDPGETITVIEASTGKVLSTHKVSLKASPSGAAPVEIAFVPKSNPPVAYINNMYEGTLWMAVWDPGEKAFDFSQADDFGPRGQGVPLVVHFNPHGDRLFITTAKPGHLNVYDISNPRKPRHLMAIATAGGAHHTSLSPDERYVFVQNSFVNLPGMSDGSIMVVDLRKQEVIKSFDTLKNQGMNPNSMVLLPEWSKGHTH
ncbi:MAG: YncE family protein [Candidatus Methylomirabilales bacterium]